MNKLLLLSNEIDGISANLNTLALAWDSDENTPSTKTIQDTLNGIAMHLHRISRDMENIQ